MTVCNNLCQRGLQLELCRKTSRILFAKNPRDDAERFIVLLGEECLTCKVCYPQFNLPEWSRIEAIFQENVLAVARDRALAWQREYARKARLEDTHPDIPACHQQKLTLAKDPARAPLFTLIQTFIDDPIQIFLHRYDPHASDAAHGMHCSLLCDMIVCGMTVFDCNTVNEASLYSVFRLQSWWVGHKLCPPGFAILPIIDDRIQELFQQIVLRSVTDAANQMLENATLSEARDFLSGIAENPMTFFSTPFAPSP